jgi:hypothetical protein
MPLYIIAMHLDGVSVGIAPRRPWLLLVALLLRMLLFMVVRFVARVSASMPGH